MPTYEYFCSKCNVSVDVFHYMSDEQIRHCEKCNSEMEKQIGSGYGFINKSGPSLYTDIKDREERAKHLRNQPVKRSHSGVGSGKGRAIAGQHMEVNKQDFIKACAKDDLCVKLAQDALKKRK